MDIEKLIRFLEEKDELEILQKLRKPLNVPAKTMLLREGETAVKMYIVKQGCLREFFYKGDKDISLQFFMEGEAVASAESYMLQKPGSFYIETLERSLLYELHRNDFCYLSDKYPELKIAFLEGVQQRFLFYIRQFTFFIKNSPMERYVELVKKYPAIVNRVPQHYIASYLGITPVSLSRLRSKAAKEKLLS